uniref:Uncharacterized protein n=1 Tax=Arundo donax TaxID=35708 RepID=A0A0A9FST3_ARUDO
MCNRILIPVDSPATTMLVKDHLSSERGCFIVFIRTLYLLVFCCLVSKLNKGGSF